MGIEAENGSEQVKDVGSDGGTGQNILVKHPRSGLHPTVLYKSSYLHYITLQRRKAVNYIYVH